MKRNREAVYVKFDGRCAYCGIELGRSWHVDHLDPVLRASNYIDGKFVAGNMMRPENDVASNLMPSCAPCNIDKSVLSLEEWREKLQRAPDVLRRNNPTYRHALRFGLVAETSAQVIFFFEKCVARRAKKSSEE